MAVSSLVAPTAAAPQPPAGAGAAFTASELEINRPCHPNSLSSSPRLYSTDLTCHTLEEGDETESESPNEPVTPVSGRQSQEFTTLSEKNNRDLQLSSDPPATHPQKDSTTPTSNATQKPPLLVNTAPSPAPPTDSAAPPRTVEPDASAADQEPPPTPLSRRTTRGSTHSFKRTMSNIFRRGNSQSGKDFATFAPEPAAAATNASSDPNLSNPTQLKNSGRRFSMNKSYTTTRSNSPPSPGSPLEMAMTNRSQVGAAAIGTGTVPTSEDFKHKKNRASTGLSLRGRAVNFVSANVPGRGDKTGKRPGAQGGRRRASSFDGNRQLHHLVEPETKKDPNNPALEVHGPSPWAQLPEAGVGVKARRMSLSLPDDFTVDVAELLSEFEYQHKLFGRHGKHLGKGATSKVTLMSRKGSPTELYAVKEFRGKTRKESEEDYEKKVKSEYSIAKSLHHPNIVETIRLCTDHGRWNHVMEYCSEGDLFALVQKGYLKDEARQPDRQCLFKQLVQGINYLHSNGIAHRDIKLENLLITKDSKLKITDFGVSEVFCGTHPGLREAGGQCGQNMSDVRLCSPGMCGSEPYVAPEVLQKKESYDPRPLDVWSSAIIMIYLTFGGGIWLRASPGEAQYDVLVRGWEKWYAKHDADSEITDCDYPYVQAFDTYVKPPALRRLLLTMLNPDPTKRATIAEVVGNRWMKNVECCQLESYDDPVRLIDASKKPSTKNGGKRIFCHNHLPPQVHATHSLGKMPGNPGY